MHGKQATAVAPTTKHHYTKYNIITWPWNLCQGQGVKGKTWNPRPDTHKAKD